MPPVRLSGFGLADRISELVPAAHVGGFEVTGEPRDLGLRGAIADAFIKTCAPVMYPYTWEFPDGTTVVIDPRTAAGAREARG